MFRKFGKLAFFAVLFVVFVGCGSKDASVVKTKEKTTIEKETFGASIENPNHNKEIEKLRKEFEEKFGEKIEKLSKENESLKQKLDTFEKQKQALSQEIEKIRQEKNVVSSKELEKIISSISRIFQGKEEVPKNTEAIIRVEQEIEVDSTVQVPIAICYKDKTIGFKIINNKTGKERIYEYPYERYVGLPTGGPIYEGPYGPPISYSVFNTNIIQLTPGTYKFISYSQDGKILGNGNFTVTVKPSIYSSKGWVHAKIILGE